MNSEYYTDIIDKGRDDPVKFWQHLNDLICKKDTSKIGNVKDPISGKLLDEQDSANSLNNYYVNFTSHPTALLPTSSST